MIRLTDSGKFKLAETQHGTKVLKLNDATYAWVVAPGIGSLLIFSDYAHRTADILSEGEFRLYEVSNETNLASSLHLELQVGQHGWQGYLLLAGLPDSLDTRKRMMPTDEVISDNNMFHIDKPLLGRRPVGSIK